MISLNGTMLVQMFSFLGVWWFLDTYLLRPVVAVVEQEAAVEKNAELALENQKNDLIKKERYKQDRWYHFQLLFARATPYRNANKDCQLPEKRQHTGDALTQDEKNSLERVTAQLVVERITHEF